MYNLNFQKILWVSYKLSGNVPKFIAKKWVEVHDQSESTEDRYKPRKETRFKISMLRSDVTRPNNNVYAKKLAFKNNTSFVSCISKVINTLIDNAEDLDIVMVMYNLIECSKNYPKTKERWNK